MKKFETLQELPKCDTPTVSKYCWKNSTNGLAQYRVATDLQLVKKQISVKPNKMRYACGNN